MGEARVAGLPWGTEWELVRAADPAVDPRTHRVTLALQGERAGGRAPVNRYFGMCRDEGEGRLVLGPLGMTMMAGSPQAMAAEAAYMRLLEHVRGYRLGRDSLALLDDQGSAVLEFAPAPPVV